MRSSQSPIRGFADWLSFTIFAYERDNIALRRCRLAKGLILAQHFSQLIFVILRFFWRIVFWHYFGWGIAYQIQIPSAKKGHKGPMGHKGHNEYTQKQFW